MLQIAKRYEESVKQNQRLIEQLKFVAKAIQTDMPQPSQCLFKSGVCCYPIEDCYNCPMHEWSDYTMPLTSCEFK